MYDMFIAPQTELQCFNNIDYDQFYNNVRLFDNVSHRDSHFDNLDPYFLGSDFQHIRTNRSINVVGAYEDMQYLNYCRYKNRTWRSWIYAFITNVEYVNENTVTLHLQIDDFQTWFYFGRLEKCLIEKAHIKEYIDHLGSSYPNSFLESLDDEGLEHGADYDNVHTEHWNLSESYFLIASSLDLLYDPGTINNPNIRTAEGGKFDNSPSMMSYYVLDSVVTEGVEPTATIQEFCIAMKEYAWVARGVQSLTMIPRVMLKAENITYKTSSMGFRIGVVNDKMTTDLSVMHKIEDYRDSFTGGGNFRCSKLYNYPYSYVEITGYSGQHLILKNENMQGNTLDIYALPYIAPQPRLALTIGNYNNTSLKDGGIDTGVLWESITRGDFLNFALILGNFPQFPTLIDNYSIMMAETANSRRMEDSQIELDRSRNTQTGIKQLVSGIGQIFTATPGNAVGSLYQGVETLVHGETDHAMNVGRVMAKRTDAEITPPSLGAQSGGDGFNFAKALTGVILKWKMIKPQHFNKLTEYFIRFGYTINKFDNPTEYLRNNTELNYVKTVNSIFEGIIPTSAKRNIEAIFDRGLTVWHSDDIGSYNQNPNR